MALWKPDKSPLVCPARVNLAISCGAEAKHADRWVVHLEAVIHRGHQAGCAPCVFQTCWGARRAGSSDGGQGAWGQWSLPKCFLLGVALYIIFLRLWEKIPPLLPPVCVCAPTEGIHSILISSTDSWCLKVQQGTEEQEDIALHAVCRSVGDASLPFLAGMPRSPLTVPVVLLHQGTPGGTRFV